jgi:hypothetical protein
MSRSPHELGIHGTVDMYRRGGCRCEACTAAFMRSVPHGTLSGSRHHGCDCDACLTARRRYGREHAWTVQSLVNESAYASTPASPRTTWSVDQLRDALRAYHDAHGAFPGRKSTEGLPSGTWGAAQKWLRGQGLTLRGLLGMAAWRAHTRVEFEWSVDVVYAAACTFSAARGRWPTSKDGAMAELGGRTWGRANGWLRGQGLTLATLAAAMERHDPRREVHSRHPAVSPAAVSSERSPHSGGRRQPGG